MSMTMNSIKANDHAALNAAFAEKVAGIEREQWHYLLNAPHGFLLGDYRFTTSANAVLPWLEKSNATASFWKGHAVVWAVGVNSVVGKGKAPTFPHAAVIALLRAKGITITDE